MLSVTGPGVESANELLESARGTCGPQVRQLRSIEPDRRAVTLTECREQPSFKNEQVGSTGEIKLPQNQL